MAKKKQNKNSNSISLLQMLPSHSVEVECTCMMTISSRSPFRNVRFCFLVLPLPQMGTSTSTHLQTGRLHRPAPPTVGWLLSPDTLHYTRFERRENKNRSKLQFFISLRSAAATNCGKLQWGKKREKAHHCEPHDAATADGDDEVPGENFSF